jgi:tetrahydromethanopterin:alpha-L-glutamate ligase
LRRIALFIDEEDWHFRVLLRAFAQHGADVVPLRLADCAFNTERPDGLALPRFGGLPDAVLVREVAGGSFEEVTRRLGILHALSALNVPVWNEPTAIERCVDKSATGFLLSTAGLPTPAAWAVEGLPAARAVAERELLKGRLVLKPLFGSQGRGLRLIASADDLPRAELVGGVYYLQRYVAAADTHYEDQRLFVCNGAVIAAMTRRAEQWITNLGCGGHAEALRPMPDMVDLAVCAAARVGARYAGVDLMRDMHGRPLILEVNSMPGWRGLQKVAATDIASSLAAALVRSLR